MNVKSILRRAMHDSDHWVIEMDYVDTKGETSHRVVSPIRFVGSERFLALCLCREAPRQFYLSRCQNIRLVPAAEVLMPMPLQSASSTTKLDYLVEAQPSSAVAVGDTAFWQQPCMA